jgi:hypothetical protein
MSITNIPAALRRKVIERAMQRCEYCLIHADDSLHRHEVDHVIAEKHRGRTILGHLAYSCFACNRNKGLDLGSLDDNEALVRFFNPREDVWSQHFRIDGDLIIPLTPAGMVTERIFGFNMPERCDERRTLQQAGRYPTS